MIKEYQSMPKVGRDLIDKMLLAVGRGGEQINILEQNMTPQKRAWIEQQESFTLTYNEGICEYEVSWEITNGEVV